MDKEPDRDLETFEHSGIQERRGKVNAWLIVVYIALSAWAIWYLVAFWNHA
jgi:hypothetical protein